MKKQATIDKMEKAAYALYDLSELYLISQDAKPAMLQARETVKRIVFEDIETALESNWLTINYSNILANFENKKEKQYENSVD